MLLRLAPGLRLVRRGPHHVQVGLLDSRRVLLSRTPATAHALDLVLTHRPLPMEDPALAEVVERLVRSGCATPADPTGEAPEVPWRVAVLESGGSAPLDLRGRLRHAGLLPASGPEADATILVAIGEPAREHLDPLVRGGRPHLVVRLVDGAVLVGPFVIPGRTACLRCLDAHVAEADPDHLPVLTRYITASRTPRGDGTHDLPEQVLLDLGASMALRDLLAHSRGEQPPSWSAVVQLGPGAGQESRRVWRRHPECGCSWPGSTLGSGRMEG